MLLRFLWSCCSEGPTSPPLLSAHQGQVPPYPRWKTASNGPGSLLSQTETPPRLSRRSFLRQAPRTSRRRSLTRQSESRYPAEVATAAVAAARDAGVRRGNGEKVTGILKRRMRPVTAGSQLMSRFTLVDPVPVLMSHNCSQTSSFSFPPITVKVTASVVTLTSVHKSSVFTFASHPSSFPPFVFDLLPQSDMKRLRLLTPKTQKSSLYSGLFCSMPFLISGRKGRGATPLILDDMEALLPPPLLSLALCHLLLLKPKPSFMLSPGGGCGGKVIHWLEFV